MKEIEIETIIISYISKGHTNCKGSLCKTFECIGATFMDIYLISERKVSGVEDDQLNTALQRAKKRVRRYWRLVHLRDGRHGCVARGGLSR